MLYFLAILLFLSVITEDTARRVLSWFDSQATQSARDFLRLTDLFPRNRGTQREYSSKPLKHSIVKRILVFKR